MITEIIRTPDVASLLRAGEILKNGGLVAFPTETVYGLGANALDADAAKKIYAAKGRPSDNPLIIHLADAADAKKYAYTTPAFDALAERFMPGPLTVILPKRDNIPREVTGGLDSVAIRVPIHPTANALIRAAGVPVAAPSANISGRPSPTRTEHVIADMDGRIDMIIGGDDCEVGVESTIISLATETPCVLRPGKITVEELREVLPEVILSSAVMGKYEGAPLSPGMRYKHYSPSAAVTVLDGDYDSIVGFLSQRPEAGKLCFEGDTEIRSMPNALVCGSESDAESQARLLFALLREFDENPEIKEIYARLPQSDGVGLAVFNRLIRAAGFTVITL
ncbi:MAG: threonylcarbamoyl-AMP synthase [Clostridia bacterium]|nr:threonylcarbamoyl-AMP synthase [Clostridia bacterium]